MSGRRYVGVPEVAERYGVKPSVVYEWVAATQIPFRKLPGRKHLLFDPADLDVYDDGGTKLDRKRTPGGGVIVRPTAVTERLQTMAR